jgi:hypothetical protein
VVGHIVEGWALDGRISSRSAFPVALFGNYTVLPSGQAGYSSLNLIPGIPVYTHVPDIAGKREINAAAFSLPSSGQYGDLPRNSIRGFDMNQINFAVAKTTPLSDLVKLQFRAETFNIVNHPNFGNVDGYYGDPQFGQATEMLNNSLGNLTSLYQQGGPRSMQFALKLIF